MSDIDNENLEKDQENENDHETDAVDDGSEGDASPKRTSRRKSPSLSQSRSQSPLRKPKGGNRRSKSREKDKKSKRSRRSTSGSSPHGGRRDRSHSPMSAHRRHFGSREEPEPSRCLGVFGMSLYTAERDLRDYFGQYGPIESVQIVYDHPTGRSRGFGFVYFENTEDAIEAKERAVGCEIDGHKVRIDFSITKRAHTPTPGMYMGDPDDRRNFGDYGRDRYGRFANDRNGGDRYGSDRYGGDRYGSDRNGGDRYGSDRYGGDRYGSDRYGGDRRSPSPRYGDRRRRRSRSGDRDYY